MVTILIKFIMRSAVYMIEQKRSDFGSLIKRVTCIKHQSRYLTFLEMVNWSDDTIAAIMASIAGQTNTCPSYVVLRMQLLM